MIIMDWANATTEALVSLWVGFLSFMPKLIGALIVFIIGWFIAIFIGKLISEILIKLKFNQLFDKAGWKNALAKADLKVNPSEFIGGICKWILVIVFFRAATDILDFGAFAIFLDAVLRYIPNVIVAIFIFVVTVVLVDIIEKLMRATVEGSKVGGGHMVSSIVKVAIWLFAVMTILDQLQIMRLLTSTLFTGLVAMLVIALGIAFGLGGKDIAAEILRDFKNKMKG